jgi:hypothetical protein
MADRTGNMPPLPAYFLTMQRRSFGISLMEIDVWMSAPAEEAL